MRACNPQCPPGACHQLEVDEATPSKKCEEEEEEEKRGKQREICREKNRRGNMLHDGHGLRKFRLRRIIIFMLHTYGASSTTIPLRDNGSHSPSGKGHRMLEP